MKYGHLVVAVLFCYTLYIPSHSSWSSNLQKWNPEDHEMKRERTHSRRFRQGRGIRKITNHCFDTLIVLF